MAIDLFFYWSYNSNFIGQIIRHVQMSTWILIVRLLPPLLRTNNTSYSNECLDTYSPALTSSSVRGTAIWGNCYLEYLIGGIEHFGIYMFFSEEKIKNKQFV